MAGCNTKKRRLNSGTWWPNLLKKPAMVTLGCREKSAAVSCGNGCIVESSRLPCCNNDDDDDNDDDGGGCCRNIVRVVEAAGVAPPKPKTRLASAAGEKNPAVRDVLLGSGGNAGLDDVVDEASSTKAGLLLLAAVETEELLEDHEIIVAGVACCCLLERGVVSRLP